MNGGSVPTGGQKREKIYCDKWIHDGTCAFTQQGCKFKHEMPSDKETQMTLGLFHGYPGWWRKHMAEQQMQLDDRPVQIAAGIGAGGSGGSGGLGNGAAFQPAVAGSGRALAARDWRRLEAASGPRSSTFEVGTSRVGAGGGVRGRGGQGRTVGESACVCCFVRVRNH